MATTKKTVKPVSKKPAVKKAALTKTVKITKAVKKPATKPKPAVKKPVIKAVKSAKPIKKSPPVKKTAKPVAKKAAPKKVVTPVKIIKKSTQPAAKQVPVKQPLIKKPVIAINKIAASAKKPVKAELIKAEPKNIPVKVLPKAKDIKVPAPKPVVLPKITATKARKYEPEFTKSVLDQAPIENNGPTMRYSDGELNEFRELIQRKLETAKKELGYLQGLITRKDEMGGDDTDNRYMTMEDGSLSMEREQLSQMASRQITFIDHLEKAMMRIENKTYGICRVTGKLIDKARLRAVPHATLSIEAKMGIAK